MKGRNDGAKSFERIRLFPFLIGNLVTRKMLSGINHFCEKCGKNRLEVALELYAGNREEACAACILAKLPVSVIVATGARALGVQEEDIKRTLGDPYWRKGLVGVVGGIADFGVHRPFTPSAPFQVVWDVTNACNLRCRHCYASAGDPLPDELSTFEALSLIDKLAIMGVPIIAFSGGEPLVRRDILQLARYAHRQGIFTAMATNGTLLNKDRTREVKQAGVEYLQISLDGADAETHDSFRGIPGSFDRTVEGIKNAVNEHLFVNISTTVTRHNVGQVGEIIDLCNELGTNWFMAYNFIPAGRGRDMVDSDLTPEMREELLKLLYEKNKTSRFQVLSTAPQYARVALEQCSGGSVMVPTHFYNQAVYQGMLDLTEFIGGCGAGRFYMAIRANGNIDPCVFFPMTVGNVRKDELSAIWHKDPLFMDLRNRDMLKGNCGHCDHRFHCGGCRARANGYFDDPLEADPGCIRNAERYNELVDGSAVREPREMILSGK